MKKTLLMILSIALIMTGIFILLFGRGWNIVRAPLDSPATICYFFILLFCTLGAFVSDHFRKS